MSVGDVVSNLANIAGFANLDFQPAAGVEVMITDCFCEVFSGVTPNCTKRYYITIFNGVLNSVIVQTVCQPLRDKRLRVLINNTVYLRLINSVALATNIGYTGIQIK